jgi:hypothetical protein
MTAARAVKAAPTHSRASALPFPFCLTCPVLSNCPVVAQGGHTFSAVDPLPNRRQCVTLPVGGGGANAKSK